MTLDDLRLCVSNCFNANHVTYSMSNGIMSGYNHLSKMMIQDYDLDHNDVDEVVGEIEELVAQYIMEHSPKFTGEE
jgi:hypothetical protein